MVTNPPKKSKGIEVFPVRLKLIAILYPAVDTYEKENSRGIY
jgi:hypothetical protein